jgi:hypothetical protein
MILIKDIGDTAATWHLVSIIKYNDENHYYTTDVRKDADYLVCRVPLLQGTGCDDIFASLHVHG